MNGNTERAQCALSRVGIPEKRKRKATKRIKQIYKISKRVIKKKSCHLAPRWLKEAGNTEEGREFQRREVEGKKPSLNQLILALESSTQCKNDPRFLPQILDILRNMSVFSY